MRAGDRLVAYGALGLDEAHLTEFGQCGERQGRTMRRSDLWRRGWRHALDLARRCGSPLYGWLPSAGLVWMIAWAHATIGSSRLCVW